MAEKPYVEILVPPNVKMANVTATGIDDVRIVQMPAEEMCLEDMPTIEADLSDLDS